MPATPISTTSIPPRDASLSRRKDDTDGEAFRDALGQQSLERLAAILSPSATASLPGAGVALASAADAPPPDVAGLAAKRLTTQERQQGIRDRGQDASSASATELKTRATHREQPETAASSAQAQADPTPRAEATRASAEPRLSSEQAPEASANRGSAVSASSDRSAAPAATQPQQSQPAQATSSAVAVAPAASVARVGSQQNAVHAVNRVGAAVATASQPGQKGTPNATPFTVERAGAKADRSYAPAKPTRDAQRQDPTAQVQRGLAQILRQRGGTLTMKLTPHELGEVKIALNMRQSRVEGTIDAKTVQARDLLKQNIDALKASLEQRGVTVDRLEVRLQGAAESEQRSQPGAEPQGGNARAHADAGGDRPSGFAGGEERQTGGRDGYPGSTHEEADRGATVTARDDGHGRPVELAGGRLRLDTTA